MVTERTTTRRRRASGAAAAVLALLAAAPAAHAAGAVELEPRSEPVLEEQAFSVGYRVVDPEGTHFVYLTSKPGAPGAGCASRPEEDAGDEVQSPIWHYPEEGWNRSELMDRFDPGAVLICAWTQRNGQVTGRDAQVVAVRAARASVAITEAPAQVTAGDPVSVRVTGTVERERVLVTELVPRGACPALPAGYGRTVRRTFDVADTVAPSGRTGPVTACAWIVDEDGTREAEAVASRDLEVVPRPAPRAPVHPVTPPQPQPSCPPTTGGTSCHDQRDPETTRIPVPTVRLSVVRHGRRLTGRLTGATATHVRVLRADVRRLVGVAAVRPDGTFRVRLGRRSLRRPLIVRLVDRTTGRVVAEQRVG